MAPYGYNLSTGGIGYGNLGRKVKIQGKKFKTIKDAAKHYGVNPGTFVTRLSNGRTLEQAAGIEKYDIVSKNHIKVKIDGKEFNNVRLAAKFYGLHDHVCGLILLLLHLLLLRYYRRKLCQHNFCQLTISLVLPVQEFDKG